MALMHVNFFSDALRRAVSVDVILPEASQSLIGMETTAADTYKTLYLLHGLSDDQTIWQRRTSIERYVANRNYAVIMPNGDRSWYCNEVAGGAYLTYVAEELPRVMKTFFRGISGKREDTFIAGLSMGGYGALKIGCLHPEAYAGIGGMSSAVDLKDCLYRQFPGETERIVGSIDNIDGSENDVLHNATQAVKAGKTLPSIYMWCGTDDVNHIEPNRRLQRALQDLGASVSYHESAGGHTWDMWDREIQNILDFFDGLNR